MGVRFESGSRHSRKSCKLRKKKGPGSAAGAL
jgi:hypothetical protein